MFKSLTVISLVAAVVAQNTLIPSGLEAGCSSFLQTLNADSELTSCTRALGTALSAFAPGANTTSTAATVNTALTNVCSESISNACPKNVLASKITAFGSACARDLTTNQQVLRLYDVLYVLPALQKAVCSKNDDGAYCVTQADLPSGTSASALKSSLYVQNGDYYVPDTTAFANNNLPFLLINPDSSNLCTACTRNVLNAFIEHESDIPYAPPMVNSLLLTKQAALFDAVDEKCDAGFMNQAIQAAGGLSHGILGGSKSAAAPGAEVHTFVAALAGFATLAASALL